MESIWGHLEAAHDEALYRDTKDLTDPEWLNSGKTYQAYWPWSTEYTPTDILAFDTFRKMKGKAMQDMGCDVKWPEQVYWYDNTGLPSLPEGLNSCDDFLIGYAGTNVAKVFSAIGDDKYGIVTSDLNTEKRFAELLGPDSELTIVRQPQFLFNRHTHEFKSREPLVQFHSAYERLTSK